MFHHSRFFKEHLVGSNVFPYSSPQPACGGWSIFSAKAAHVGSSLQTFRHSDIQDEKLRAHRKGQVTVGGFMNTLTSSGLFHVTHVIM